MALETLRDPAAAEPLAQLLAKPDMTGHAVTQVTGAETPAAKSTARCRCGKSSWPARSTAVAITTVSGGRILETYEKDLHGLYARHAQAVLREKK